ncbi:MAG: uncharacterized protein JWN39_1395, partial [Ilumatobacteraceae bacterium]|nr:uncharacterized protein [Ilumatobacteraceae bacterium]
GTSIVIIAPRFQLRWQTEMNRIRDAVRWHVWPKRVPGVRDPALGADMEIRLGWNNNSVSVPSPLDDPEIRPYARALLDCARERKDDEQNRDVEARCNRPQKVLGAVKFRSAGSPDQNVFHLTLTESDISSDVPAGSAEHDFVDAEPAVDFASPWGQIALIRREPLLLVRYEPIGGPEAAATEVGVFLSAEDAEVEGALTKAEPPAHDDWIFQIVPKDHSRDHRRTLVKRTLEEIKRAKSKLIAGFRTTALGELGGGEHFVSRQISDGLLGGVGGGRPPKPLSPSSSVVSSKPRALLVPVRSDQDGDNTVHELDVALHGLGTEPTSVLLTADGSGHDSAGSMPVGQHVSFSWITANGAVTPGASLATSGTDATRLSLIVTVASSLRFRPKVSVEVSDAP